MDATLMTGGLMPVAVIPILIGPLQVLLALLPAIAVAVFGVLVSLLKPRTVLSALKLAWKLKFHLAAAAAVVAAGVWGARRILPAGGAAGAASPRDERAEWLLFRGGPQRTGLAGATNAPSPAAGAINWAWKAEGVVFYASPAVVGNRVYVSSSEGIGPFDRDGTGALYCFDADTGALVWRHSPRFGRGAKGYRATFASPVVKGTRLVCGEGLHFTPNCRVVCLDISREDDVKLAWSHATDSHVECTPVIGTVRIEVEENGAKSVREEDRVFVGAGDKGGYYCFDLATGELRWNVRGASYLDAETALTVRGNRLYAGLGNEGKALCVLDAVTGREIARVPTPYPVFAPPAWADNTLYVGMGNGDFVNSASDLGLKPAGMVWAVDMEKLERAGGGFEPDWKVETDDTVLGAVAVSGGDLFCASARGTAYRVDRASGRILARWEALAPVKASPAVTERHVYVVTASGTLYGLNRADLKVAWECRVGGGDNFSSPAVAAGRVYVGTGDSGLVCAGRPAAPGAYVWPSALGGPGRAGNIEGLAAPERGQFEWNWPEGLSGTPPAAFVAAPPAVAGDGLLVPVALGGTAGLRTGLVCLRSKTGDSAPTLAWHCGSSNGVHASPAVLGARAIFADGRPGDGHRRLRCVAAADGRIAWSRPIAAAASGQFAAAEDGILVQDEPGRLTWCAPDGQARWTADVGGSLAGPPTLTPSLAIAPLGAPPRLAVLDRGTGAAVAAAELAFPPATSVFVDGARAYFGTSRGLEAWSLTTGRPLEGWSCAGGAVSGEFAALNDVFVYVNTNAQLVAVKRADGVLAGQPVAGASAGCTPLPAGPRVLFLDAQQRICAVETEALCGRGAGAPAPKVWLEDTSALGAKPSAPMVLGGAALFIPWQGWGLVRIGPAR